MKKTMALALSLALVLSMAIVPAAAVAEAETERTPLEVYIVNPWVTSELPPVEEDVYKTWIDETFNCDFKLSYSADGETELMTRFTSGNAPDVIRFADFSTLQKFYDQGALLEDWTPYLDKVDAFVERMGEDQVRFFTRDGKLIALASEVGGQYYNWMIRQDWLANLNMDMPTNMDELYDVLYAFTYNDPDGNGVDDTYGITAAGGGEGVGEIGNLQLFFGNNTWYIDDNGEVSHPILDGTYKDYLDFAKKCYDGGVMDPNWYTQGWEDRKSELFAGSYGMCWYPPKALLDENKTARGDEVADEWWGILPMFQGKLDALGITGESIVTITPDCAADEAKLNVICNIFNAITTPNDDYYRLNWYYEIDHGNMTRMDDGTVYYWFNEDEYELMQRGSGENAYIATALYSEFLRCSGADNIFGGGTSPEPDAHTKLAMELTAENLSMERYSSESAFLTLDPTTQSEASMVSSEFTINYIMGVDSDYDAFVENWLAAGGEALRDEAVQQLTDWGFIQ